jgi:superfamily II DNA/RNA helicase
VLHLIVVRRFEYASDPESYTSGSGATGRADHVRNEEVLLRVNEQRNILHEIRKRKAN